MSTRREIVLALAACTAAPRLVFAQQRVWRVGFLLHRHLDRVDSDFSYGPFMQGMRELGYVEGKNLVVEWRSAEFKVERLPELAEELVRLKVDVLLSAATASSLAAQKATQTIPIVMVSIGDPVGAGLVKSLARPEGNATGLSNLSGEYSPKRLELLHSVMPKVTRFAFLWNHLNRGEDSALKTAQDAAQKLGVKLLVVGASTPQEITDAFAVMRRERIGALMVSPDSVMQQQGNRIAELAATQRLPSIGAYADYAATGGLIGYGTNVREIYKRAATYVDKIFKGAKPGDLPIEQPTKFELAVNLKTAKALGLKLPNSVLMQATKVIE